MLNYQYNQKSFSIDRDFNGTMDYKANPDNLDYRSPTIQNDEGYTPGMNNYNLPIGLTSLTPSTYVSPSRQHDILKMPNKTPLVNVKTSINDTRVLPKDMPRPKYSYLLIGGGVIALGYLLLK